MNNLNLVLDAVNITMHQESDQNYTPSNKRVQRLRDALNSMEYITPTRENKPVKTPKPKQQKQKVVRVESAHKTLTKDTLDNFRKQITVKKPSKTDIANAKVEMFKKSKLFKMFQAK